MIVATATVGPAGISAHAHLDLVDRRLSADAAARGRVEVALEPRCVERMPQIDGDDVVLLLGSTSAQ